jgi:hypothetical protein
LRLQVVRADDQASPPSPDLHKPAPRTGSPRSEPPVLSRRLLVRPMLRFLSIEPP